jgi:hypothetical protein
LDPNDRSAIKGQLRQGCNCTCKAVLIIPLLS